MSKPTSKVREIKMSESDFLKLKRERDAIVKKYVFFSVIAFFLLIASVLGSFMYVPAIIPAVLMLILMRVFWHRMTRAKQLYILEEKEGIKECYQTRILDVQMDNIRPYECWITTDIGKHKVSTQLFSLVEEKETAILCTGKNSGWLINIQTPNTVKSEG